MLDYAVGTEAKKTANHHVTRKTLSVKKHEVKESIIPSQLSQYLNHEVASRHFKNLPDLIVPAVWCPQLTSDMLNYRRRRNLKVSLSNLKNLCHCCA